MRANLVLLVLLLLLVTGCGGGEPAAASDGLQIVTTTSMITDITKVVGGDQVTVNGLMGAGIDPHLYVASEGDMELLQNADVIFYNGLFLICLYCISPSIILSIIFLYFLR